MIRFTWILMVGAALLPRAAYAERPAMCSLQPTVRAYDVGYTQMKKKLETLWSQAYGCPRLEPFVQSIDFSVPPSSVEPFLRCRNLGMAAAIEDVVVEKHATCNVACSESGDKIGEIHGSFFCNFGPFERREDVARALSQPPRLCRIVSEQACRDALTRYVDTRCSDLSRRDFTAFQQFVTRVCGAQ